MNDVVLGRALAALRFVDATTSAPILRPLSVSAEGTRFVRNRRGFYVITRCDALPRYDESFEQAPATPAAGAVPLTVTAVDRARVYLPRRAVVRLPRSADPALADDPGSVFQPVRVAMFPSPGTAPEPGWAQLRVRVSDAVSGDGLPHALVRVHRADDANVLLGLGLCDVRGEAFVPIAGIPTVNWSSDPDNPVLADSVDAVVEACFDADAGAIADPSDLELRRASLPRASVPVSLAPGREVFASVEVTLP